MLKRKSLFKRILVAIDEGKIADKALHTAIHLAKQQKASLRVVHVANYADLLAGTEGINIDALRKSAKKIGKEILIQSVNKALKKGVKAEKKLIESDDIATLPDKIIKEATRWRASLIVIGTHGHRGVDRLLLGSVAENVAKNATIPVLIMRGR